MDKDYISVKVLDLRQNDISSVNNTVLIFYPNLKIIDLRQNPDICGKIQISGVVIKSDCPTMPTYSVISYSTSSIYPTWSIPIQTTLPITLHQDPVPLLKLYQNLAPLIRILSNPICLPNLTLHQDPVPGLINILHDPRPPNPTPHQYPSPLPTICHYPQLPNMSHHHLFPLVITFKSTALFNNLHSPSPFIHIYTV